MVVPFSLILRHYATFLQKILLYHRSLDVPSDVEVNVDVFPEARGIVVTDCLGVPESFQDRVGFQDLLFDPGMLPTYRGEVLQD